MISAPCRAPDSTPIFEDLHVRAVSINFCTALHAAIRNAGTPFMTTLCLHAFNDSPKRLKLASTSGDQRSRRPTDRRQKCRVPPGRHCGRRLLTLTWDIRPALLVERAAIMPPPACRHCATFALRRSLLAPSSGWVPGLHTAIFAPHMSRCQASSGCPSAAHVEPAQ